MDHFRDYCQVYADTLALEETVGRLGYEAAKALGAYRDLKGLRELVLKYRDRLGLTPSSRTNIRVKPPEKGPDGAADFLTGKRQA